jgi:hypothetical protein
LTVLAPLFVPEDVREALSDEAWLEAVTDVERARINASALAGRLLAHEAARLVEEIDPWQASPEVIETAALLIARNVLRARAPQLSARVDVGEELDLAPFDPAQDPFAELADLLDNEWSDVLRSARDWRVRCTALNEALAFT